MRASADEHDDLDLSAGLDGGGRPFGLADDGTVELDGDALGVDVELFEEIEDVEMGRNLAGFAIDFNYDQRGCNLSCRRQV